MAREGSRGFTLMETLVMLMLVSFAALLMFQMLGNYRLASGRVLAQAGVVDRQALFDAWLGESVRGLYPVEDAPLEGTATGFSGVTLNPLFAEAGAPTAIAWSLDPQADGSFAISYAEQGLRRWSLPVVADGPHFAYIDEAGERHAQWPPGLGEQAGLPRSIILFRDGVPSGIPLAATVRGPLQPVPRPYQVYED